MTDPVLARVKREVDYAIGSHNTTASVGMPKVSLYTSDVERLLQMSQAYLDIINSEKDDGR